MSKYLLESLSEFITEAKRLSLKDQFDPKAKFDVKFMALLTENIKDDLIDICKEHGFKPVDETLLHRYNILESHIIKFYYMVNKVQTLVYLEIRYVGGVHVSFTIPSSENRDTGSSIPAKQFDKMYPKNTIIEKPKTKTIGYVQNWILDLLPKIMKGSIAAIEHVTLNNTPLGLKQFDNL